MSEYSARIEWRSDHSDFVRGEYSRAHTWHFDGGAVVPASSSPHIVPLPHSDASAVDPEEAFVAALSSCHMLFFLSLAAQRGYVIERYVDEAVGTLARDEHGRQAMTRVTLRPTIRFAGERQPDAAQIERLHAASHRQCFIANSVRTEVSVASPDRLSGDGPAPQAS